MSDKEEVFRTMPYKRAVFTMALPCVTASLVLVVYNMADTFFVGQTGNPMQVAAVSLTNGLYVMYMAVANLIGIGGSTVISVLLGAGEGDRAKSVSSFCFWGSVAAGAVIGAAVLIFMEPLLNLLGAAGDTRVFASDYLFYIAAGAPSIFVAVSFGHVLRGEGAASASMAMGIIGPVVNIVLDPVFILTFGMGTAGAAIATVLGTFCSCLFCACYLLRGKSYLSVHPRYLKGRARLCLRAMRAGLPAWVDSALMSIATVLLNNALVLYGDRAVAAMGIINKVYLFSVFVHMGITNGVQPILGYCRGAMLRERFFSVMKFGGLLTVICGTALALANVCFSGAIVRFFIDDAEVIALGARMLVLVSLAAPILGLLFLSINTMLALERTVNAAMVSVCRQGLFFIPLLYILRSVLGLDGVSITQTAADYLTVVISLVMLRHVLKTTGTVTKKK